MPKSDIAFGSEFSPEQINLPEVLEIAARHEGDRAALLKAIQERWYPDPDVAKNLPLSLSAYRIIDWGRSPDDASPETERRTRYHITEAGRRLVALREHPEKLYGELGRHVLLEVPGGMDLLTVIEDLSQAGESTSMVHVRDELSRRGLYVPKNGMHATRIRQWLEKAGVISPEPYRVDQERKAELLGFTTTEIEALAGLTKAQKSFARALARMNVQEIASNEVARYASEQYGVRFPDTGLPGAVIDALEERGLVTYTKTTGGRGAKPGIVRPTQKLQREVFGPILDAIEKIVGLEYRHFVRTSMDDVLRDIGSTNKHVKGKALEALAAKIAFLIGLEFVFWRLRGADTGGAEVDVVVQGAAPVFLRWNIQCKNTAFVRLDDVAKEVGLAYEMGSSVVMLVSTGKFSTDARDHAKHVMRRTNLNVILIDGRDIAAITASPAAIGTILERASQEAKAVKKLTEER